MGNRKSIVFFLFLIIIVIGCSKNIDNNNINSGSENSKSDFVVNISAPDSIVFGFSLNGSFTINERNSKNNRYTLTINHSEKDAIININGKEYQNWKIITGLNTGEFSFSIKSNKVGNQSIEFIITDQNNLSKSILKNYKTTPGSYSINFSTIKTNITMAEKGLINVELTSEAIGVNNIYDIKFNGLGSIEYNGLKYTSETSPIKLTKPGNYTFSYIPIKEGKVDLLFTITDLYKRTLTKSLTFEIVNPNFSLSTNSTNNNTHLVGIPAPILLNINFEGNSNKGFFAKLIGQGTFSYAGITKANEQYFPLTTSESHVFSFLPFNSATGSFPITVVVKNQFGVEKTSNIILTFINGTLTASITFDKEKYALNEYIYGIIQISENPTQIDRTVIGEFSFENAKIKAIYQSYPNPLSLLSFGKNNIFIILDEEASSPQVDKINITLKKPGYNTATISKSIDLSLPFIEIYDDKPRVYISLRHIANVTTATLTFSQMMLGAKNKFRPSSIWLKFPFLPKSPLGKWSEYPLKSEGNSHVATVRLTGDAQYDLLNLNGGKVEAFFKDGSGTSSETKEFDIVFQ